MKRLLLLLLFVLPFQFAWAAAGAVCLHQAEPPSHFGHHAKVSKQNSSDPRDSGSLAGDADDCQTCGSHAFKIAMPGISLPDVASARGDFVHVASLRSPIPPDRPERPQWRALD